MDKKKLTEMIDGIDDRYLLESEESDMKTGKSRSWRLVLVPIAAAVLVLTVGIIAFKKPDIKTEVKETEKGSTGIAAATIESVVQIPDKTEAAESETTEVIYDGFDLNEYYGSYNTAELVYRSYTSSHGGDDKINGSDIFIMNADRLYLKVNDRYTIDIDNPVYERNYTDDESNNYGFAECLQPELDKIKAFITGEYRIYDIKGGYNKIRLIITDESVYIYTGIVYGVYHVYNSNGS